MNKWQNQINIPSILKIGKGEINNLGLYLKDFSIDKVACFYSSGIEEILGDKLDSSLARAGIEVVHENTIDIIDIESVIHTAFSIPKGTKALIGIGGGKALDYSKYCAHVLSLPYISVPTSTSNDGFCSPGASLIVDGKRKSVNASIPFGVVVDIDIIKSSPLNCIYSGIGDLISKVSACWDWQAAAQNKSESFNDFAYLIAQNSVKDFLSYQFEDIRSHGFLYNLVNSLLMSGIAMEIAGSSRPASGSEHLISHSLDMISQRPRMHGLQVGVASYLCSALQNNQNDLVRDFLMNTGFFDFVSLDPLNKQEFIDSITHAPKVKDLFYTVLTEPDSVDNAISLIENDELLKKVIR